MTFGLRLRDTRRRAGLTQKDLAGRLGVKHNTVSNWEKNKCTPGTNAITGLCRLLGTTPNFLLTGVDGNTDVPTLSSDERALLERYRLLDNVAKGAVGALLDFYCKPAAMKRPPMLMTVPIRESPHLDFIPGKLSTQSVAAGTGTYLDEDSFATVTLQDTPQTRRAAFYVPVSGNSMEPRYHDGDILIIEDAPVAVGEIGVFTLEGQGYVKVRGQSELISLNPDYAPIPMHDGIICNGRVTGILNPDFLVE